MRNVCLTGALIWWLGNLLFPLLAAEKRLVILGDSLTAGYGIAKEDAYPALIQKRLEAAGEPWKVINGGRSGDTTKNGLARLRWLMKRPADMLIIALGGNDGLRGLKADEMEKNLKAMVAMAREKSPDIAIVLVGMEMPDNMGKEYVEAFQAVYPRVAESEKLTLIPFLLKGIAGVERYNLDDRVHPNEDGHKIMAETVWNGIEALLRGDE